MFLFRFLSFVVLILCPAPHAYAQTLWSGSALYEDDYAEPATAAVGNRGLHNRQAGAGDEVYILGLSIGAPSDTSLPADIGEINVAGVERFSGMRVCGEIQTIDGRYRGEFERIFTDRPLGRGPLDLPQTDLSQRMSLDYKLGELQLFARVTGECTSDASEIFLPWIFPRGRVLHVNLTTSAILVNAGLVGADDAADLISCVPARGLRQSHHCKIPLDDSPPGESTLRVRLTYAIAGNDREIDYKVLIVGSND